MNLSRSTSRITSPVVRGGEHLELIWMQNAAGGLRPVLETTDGHPIRSRLPSPGQMGGALAAALTAVAAASALAEVMARFAPQTLPGVL